MGNAVSEIDANFTEVGGGYNLKGYREITEATSALLVTDKILHITYTLTGAVTNFELPTAQALAGRIITIKDGGNNAGTNSITITTEGSELIEFGATAIINSDGSAIDLYSDGTDWFIK